MGHRSTRRSSARCRRGSTRRCASPHEAVHGCGDADHGPGRRVRRRLRERRSVARGGRDVERVDRVLAQTLAPRLDGRGGPLPGEVMAATRVVRRGCARSHRRGGAPRIVLLGFSMGGAVSVAVAGEPAVEEVVGLAPWIPDQLDVSTLRRKRLTVFHGRRSTAGCRASGVSASHSKKGFDRARERGADGRYVVIPGAPPASRSGLRGETSRAAEGRALGGARRGGAAALRQLSLGSRRRRASWSPDGVLTFRTSRARSIVRITHHETSTWAVEAVSCRRGKA